MRLASNEYTVNLAFNAPVLLAIQRYIPASSSIIPVSVNTLIASPVLLVEVNDVCIVKLSFSTRTSPFFNQVMDGTGKPYAVQVNTT